MLAGMDVSVSKLTVRLDAELSKRLRLVAVREDKSVQEIVAGLVGAYVARKEGENGGQ